MYGWRVNFEVQSLDIEARKGVIEADILWPVLCTHQSVDEFDPFFQPLLFQSVSIVCMCTTTSMIMICMYEDDDIS